MTTTGTARPKPSDYREWSMEIDNLLTRIEEAHGDNPAGAYPHPVEMALRLAQMHANYAADTSL